MKKIRSLFLSISATAFGVSVLGAQIPPKNLEACDVVWTSLGLDSQDSMPLGNGDIGLNVWTEPNGDIVFYISKTDAWSEKSGGPYGLVKVGRVRLSTAAPTGAAPSHFQQALRLLSGEITVRKRRSSLPDLGGCQPPRHPRRGHPRNPGELPGLAGPVAHRTGQWFGGGHPRR